MLLGAALAWLAGRQQHRLTLTLDMHRYGAGELLESNHTLDLRAIIRFYERLWLAIRKRRVVRREIRGLFGEIFDWWYRQSFRHQLLPLDIQPSRDIAALHEWILKRTAPADLESWRDGHVFWGNSAHGGIARRAVPRAVRLPA
jgi:hypothetical protein